MGSWTFATMPKAASAKLGKRGRVPIAGTINGFAFRSSAFPDGEGSHTIQVNADMRAGAKAERGESATFVIAPATDDVAVDVPPVLSKALKGNAKAWKQWESITPKARDEWVKWIASAKQEATREARTGKTVARLARGDKRPSD